VQQYLVKSPKRRMKRSWRPSMAGMWREETHDFPPGPNMLWKEEEGRRTRTWTR
jgi:hypothetical protein